MKDEKKHIYVEKYSLDHLNIQISFSECIGSVLQTEFNLNFLVIIFLEKKYDQTCFVESKAR
jgi:hypothetical protein